MSEILERGDIFFLYRPESARERPQGEANVDRLYAVLHPEGEVRERLLALGQTHLPTVREDKREIEWAVVERVGAPKDVGKALTGEQGERGEQGGEQAERAAVRPAAEGRYAIVKHEDHTHLAYALELPRPAGKPQHDLNIEREASYVIGVQNPVRSVPTGVGLDEFRREPGRNTEFPQHLKDKFEGRRFSDADPPAFLDNEGAALVLITAAANVKEDLGIQLDAQKEDKHSLDLLRQLRLERDEHPRRALFDGEWA